MERVWETWAAWTAGALAILCTVVGVIGGALKETGAAAGVAGWLCSDFWFPLAIILILLAIGFLVHQKVRKG